MDKISVIGAGSWGTALAYILAENGHSVCLHSHNSEVAKEINEKNKNTRYLPGIELPKNIKSTTDYETALKNVEYVLFVVPSHASREVIKQVKPYIKKETLIMHATKGLEIGTSKTISEIIKEELNQNAVVLSGPSHAEEVVRRLPTTLVAACVEPEKAKIAQNIFMNQNFRVYTNDDVKGVEIGGSLKNIIALAAGISDGLGYGDNAKAALLTRGLAEIIRLGVSLGANPLTFSGLTGMGDLIVTGTSKHSRNWKTGYLLAQNNTLENILKEIGMVAEGVKTTKAVYLFAKEKNIEMPITNEMYSILFENKEPKKAVQELMCRYKTNE